MGDFDATELHRWRAQAESALAAAGALADEAETILRAVDDAWERLAEDR